MTRFKDLLYSLTTVLVRYHDSQSGVDKLIVESDTQQIKTKSRKYAIDIINNPNKPCDKVLEDLINSCTKYYPDRRPFLHFLRHEIDFLKAMQTTNSSFETGKLEELKRQLRQLVIDFQYLLKTTKSVNYNVTCSKKDNERTPSAVQISLTGLVNNSYLGNTMCNSGTILKEELFDRFSISLTSTPEEIGELMNAICDEHQNTLLVPELTKQAKQLSEKNSELIEKASPMQLKIEELEKALKEKSETLKARDEVIKNLEQRVSDLSKPASSRRAPFNAYGLNPSFFGPNFLTRSPTAGNALAAQSSTPFDQPD
jgi:hypothetical protein